MRLAMRSGVLAAQSLLDGGDYEVRWRWEMGPCSLSRPAPGRKLQSYRLHVHLVPLCCAALMECALRVWSSLVREGWR